MRHCLRFGSALTLALTFWITAAIAQPILVTTDTNNATFNSIDIASGSGSLIGNLGVAGYMAGLAYDFQSHTLYGTTTITNQLYEIDPETGEATEIGPLGVELMHGLAFDPSTETLFGTYGEPEGDGLYQIDTVTGQATLVGHVGFFFQDHRNAVSGLAFHPTTGVLYGSVTGPAGTSVIITIDSATGMGTLIGATQQTIVGLAFHPGTAVLYGIDNGAGGGPRALYTIDITTGLGTLIGEMGLGNTLGLSFAQTGPVATEQRSWGSLKSLFD